MAHKASEDQEESKVPCVQCINPEYFDDFPRLQVDELSTYFDGLNSEYSSFQTDEPTGTLSMNESSMMSNFSASNFSSKFEMSKDERDRIFTFAPITEESLQTPSLSNQSIYHNFDRDSIY